MEDITKPISRKTGRLIAKNLIILIVMVVVCILLIWAWFTNRQISYADGINIKSSADGVQVSWDGENWYNDLTALSDADVEDGITGLAKNISGIDNVPEPLNLITGNGLKFFEPYLNRRTGDVLKDSNGIWQGVNIAPSDSEGKYIDIDLHFRGTFPKDIYLAGDSLVSPKDITQRYSEYGLFSKDYIAAASRVAFLNSDKSECSFIWAPNADIELEESEAVFNKYTTTKNTTVLGVNTTYYPIAENTSCVLANPDYGFAISSGQNYKKAVSFTDDTKNSISPVSVTMAEQFIAEKASIEGQKLWQGSVELGYWSGYIQLSSSDMTNVEVGDIIRVTVENAQSDAQLEIQTSNWGGITGFGYKDVGGNEFVDFKVTASNINTVKNGVIVKGKNATLVSVGCIKTSESASVIWQGSVELGYWSGKIQISSSDMANVEVGDIIRVTVENAQGDAQVEIQDSSWNGITGFGYKDVGGNDFIDFEVTASNIDTVKNGINVQGKNATLVSVDRIKTIIVDSSPSTYKFKNKNTNTYLDITNGTVTLSATGSEFTLCHFAEHEGPVLKSGDYYLVIEKGNVTAVKESDLKLEQAVTVYTGSGYSLNTGLTNDSQAYTYYDSDSNSLITLGSSTTPKLFTSTSSDQETKLIGNTKIATLEKTNATDEYYTAHIVMRLWAEGTDREAKTPLADGIFEASLHFISQ